MSFTSTYSSGADLDALFQPFKLKGLTLPNRIVMPAMGRCFAVDGVLDPAYPAYFRRRVEGGVALVIGEAAAVGDPVASSSPVHAWFHGEAPLAAWKAVVDEVHAADGFFMPQLWHAGLLRGPGKAGAMPNPHLPPLGPSGWAVPLVQPLGVPGNAITEAAQLSAPMSHTEIDRAIGAFGQAAADAQRIGCDGIQLHGAHGYLIDQFFWDQMNFRDDIYGGDLASRTRFAAEVVAECRRRTGPDFPILFRFSQWKQQDYGVKLAHTPEELARFLEPLAMASVDLFDCSTRRFWEPEFAGSTLNLAGWTKKLTGVPTMTVGSVGLEKANWDTDQEAALTDSGIASLEPLVERLEQGEFDLVGVGRTLIANPDWPNLVRQGAHADIRPYSNEALYTLF